MSEQNYNNHVRYYIPHHFVFYPISCLLLFFGVYKALKSEGELAAVWWMLTIILALIIGLSFMLRQHYALTLQNRMVVLETHLRYFKLTGKDFEPVERRLSFQQIAALRFASDEEFLFLLQKAVDENTDPATIKRSIKTWRADYRRV
ncbi:hypothetical protein PIECOFPK_01474 [Mycovorax composti]|uniref:ABC transporter permease n=2 Tax=Chitinophagaceae TaxID=563835 RepID=A0ABZ2EKM1_9BACT